MGPHRQNKFKETVHLTDYSLCAEILATASKKKGVSTQSEQLLDSTLSGISKF